MTYINTYPFDGLTYNDLVEISKKISIEYSKDGHFMYLFYFDKEIDDKLSLEEKYNIMKENNITNIDQAVLSYIYFLSEVAKTYMKKTDNDESINTYLNYIIKQIYFYIRDSKSNPITIIELLNKINISLDTFPSYLYYILDILTKMQGYEQLSKEEKRKIEPLEVDLKEYVLKFKNENNAS